MKNTRCFKWTALLTAVIMVLGLGLSAVSAAEEGFIFSGEVYEQAPLDERFVDSAVITDSSDKEVPDLAAADPNNTFTLHLSVKEDKKANTNLDKLPENTDEAVMTYQLPNMTAENGENTVVSWTYTSGVLEFHWKGEKQTSFTADISIRPNYPATNADLSGTYILQSYNGGMVTTTMWSKDNRARVRARKLTKDSSGKWTHDGFENTAWTLTRITGDWYTVSSNGQYIKLYAPNNLTLTTDAETAQLLHVVKSKNNGYYAFQAEGLELNNPSHNLANGFASYQAGNPANAGDNNQFRLLDPSELNTAPVADLSGSWVILNDQYRTLLGNEATATGRLAAAACEPVEDRYMMNGTPAEWTFESIGRNWYYVSSNGKYLNISSSGVELKDEKQPIQIRTNDGYKTIVLANGIDDTVYVLGNKSSKASDGYTSVKVTTNDATKMKLISKAVLIDENTIDTYLSFNVNGGNVGIAPNVGLVEEGQVITLPDYSGTKNNKRFIGWAKVSNIYTNPAGRNNCYQDVYPAGSSYTVPAGKTTLYAVYNEKALKAQFGFRKDGTIPDEPSNYPAKDYSEHVYIENAVKDGKWVVDVNAEKEVEGNHVANDVVANLNALPTDEQIKQIMPDYDPETQYVHWYVLKYSGNMWKVDGVLRDRGGKKTIAYDTNVNHEFTASIKNVPRGHQSDEGETVTVASDPVWDGYEFLGWSTDPDGNGDVYSAGDAITMDQNVTLYAQWDDILTVEIESNVAGYEKVYAGTVIELTAVRGGTYTGPVTYQWTQVDPDTGEEEIIPGATEEKYTFTINAENAKYLYHVTLTPVDQK